MQAKSIPEIFEVLKEHRINYVVVDNWNALPGDPIDKIAMLAENRVILQQLIGATQVQRCRFQIMLSTGKILPFIIHQKGNGFLPERFESQLIHSSVLHNNIIKVPDADGAALMSMYRWLHHYGLNLSPTELQAWGIYLDDRVGRYVVPTDDTEITPHSQERRQ